MRREKRTHDIANQSLSTQSLFLLAVLLAMVSASASQGQVSGSAASYFDRGINWYAKGELEKAITDFTKALEINPQLAEAYKNRGTAQFVKGNTEKAIADFDQAIATNPSHAKPLLTGDLPTCFRARRQRRSVTSSSA
jgi:tetratricopeptide (TPR) repeat protein